jgi:hypothetical protein
MDLRLGALSRLKGETRAHIIAYSIEEVLNWVH